jgi:HTH-type transcriptional regulator/antitoxin HigA
VRVQRPSAVTPRSARDADPVEKLSPAQVTETMMGAEVATPTLPDTYFELVRNFPLVHLRDLDHLEAASAVIDGLLRQDLDEGGRAYLGALTDLVEVFEDENVRVPGASESDVLRELMNANRLSQTRLAKEVRISQSTLSAVLNGTRSLTKAHVGRLARFFNVSASVFLPD